MSPYPVADVGHRQYEEDKEQDWRDPEVVRVLVELFAVPDWPKHAQAWNAFDERVGQKGPSHSTRDEAEKIVRKGVRWTRRSSMRVVQAPGPHHSLECAPGPDVLPRQPLQTHPKGQQ